MRSFKRHLLALPLLLSSLAASAEGESYSTDYVVCLETSNAMFRTMISCMENELVRQEVRLEANFEAILQAVEKPLQKELHLDQQLWVKHRDSDCAQNDTESEDKPYGFNKASCMLNMTRTRADNLERLLDHNLSGPKVAIDDKTAN